MASYLEVQYKARAFNNRHETEEHALTSKSYTPAELHEWNIKATVTGFALNTLTLFWAVGMELFMLVNESTQNVRIIYRPTGNIVDSEVTIPPGSSVFLVDFEPNFEPVIYSAASDAPCKIIMGGE